MWPSLEPGPGVRLPESRAQSGSWPWQRLLGGAVVLAISVCSATLVHAANAVTPGRFIVEPPTLVNLGFEWMIEGDNNRNAEVTVEYRKRGDSRWTRGLPLLRIGDERVWRQEEHLDHRTPRMFAGSILDLEEGTTYECRFTMRDPDGVRGRAMRTATVTTRTVPRAYAGGRTLHVYPPGYEGPRQEPSFTGLMQAYYGAGLGDWDVLRERAVRPGDVILVHAGLYKANRLDYVDEHRIPFHGSYVLTIDGTAERPIVIKAAGDGEVVFDGDGAHRLFDVMAADHHHFEGLTIRNTDIAFFAGHKDVGGSSGLVVRGCRMEDVGMGILAQYAGSKGFYIADNVLIGRHDPQHLVGWFRPGAHPPAPLKSYIGIKVFGQGHVIAHNRVSYFHDGIAICTHGPPSQAWGERAVAIDIYNNDIFAMVDDLIEADGGVHNIRVARNRGFNSAEQGLSVQPVFGGPAYLYRNIVYNVAMGAAIKWSANPAGVLVYHNTFVAENTFGTGCSNVQVLNNLFLGKDGPGQPILRMLTYTSYSVLDFNGYRPNRNRAPQFLWADPAKGVLRDYALSSEQRRSYATLEDFRRETGQERHGISIDYDVFRNVRPPDPSRPHAVYPVGDMDFSLREGSAAVDAGVVLPNINDDFAGRAPDLGALELGRPVPIYGPRVDLPSAGKEPAPKAGLGVSASPSVILAPSGWQRLFDGKALGSWKVPNFGVEGPVRIENGAILIGAGDPLSGITWAGGEIPRENYEFAFEAMRVSGSDFFGALTFPVGNASCTLVVGGWGGSLVGLSSLDGLDASENETTKRMHFLNRRWYRIRVRVVGRKIEAWIDDQKLFEVATTARQISIRPEVELSRPLGIATWHTTAAVRDLKLRQIK
jgi:hypothetical protein